MVKSLPPNEREPLLVESSVPAERYEIHEGLSTLPPMDDVARPNKVLDENHPDHPFHQGPEKIVETDESPAAVNAGAQNALSTGKQQLNPEASEELTKLRGTELFKQQCHFSLAKHRMAATYFGTQQYWKFTIPGATIGASSGIMAFLATSGLFSAKTNEVLNLLVGCFSFLVVFLQTLSAQLQYDTRSQMHESTAIDLRDLREDLENIVNQSIVMMKYMSTTPGKNKDLGGGSKDNDTGTGNDQGSKTDDIEKDGEKKDEEKEISPHNSPEVLFDGIQKRYNQCLKGCKSTVPLPINDAFDQLDSRLNATMTIIGHRELRRIYGLSYNNIVYFQACNDLSLEFSCYYLWSLGLPNAADAVDATMEKLQKNISKRGKDYWNVLLEDTSAPECPPESEVYMTKRQASSLLLVGILVIVILFVPMVIVQAIEWKSRAASA